MLRLIRVAADALGAMKYQTKFEAISLGPRLACALALALAACGPPAVESADPDSGSAPSLDSATPGSATDGGSAAGDAGAGESPDGAQGDGPGDAGSDQGPDPTPTPPDREGPVFTWCEFIATGADNNGLPSVAQDPDSRAGSVELNFNGWWDFLGEWSDPPFEAAILTLRNGASTILEQWHINRSTPPGVHVNGCNPDRDWPECWKTAPDAIVDGVLSAHTPAAVSSSNEGFDDSGLRVEVSGTLALDYSAPPPFTSNSHESMTLTWVAPLGLDTAQVLLRGRYDGGLDGLDGEDMMIDVFRLNLPLAPDLAPPFVTIVEMTDTQLTIEIPVQEALEWVQDDYQGKHASSP